MNGHKHSFYGGAAKVLESASPTAWSVPEVPESLCVELTFMAPDAPCIIFDVATKNCIMNGELVLLSIAASKIERVDYVVDVKWTIPRGTKISEETMVLLKARGFITKHHGHSAEPESELRWGEIHPDIITGMAALRHCYHVVCMPFK